MPLTGAPATPLRSFVIGEGTHALQGLELLLERGHVVCGVHTPDAALRAWCAGRSIPAAPEGMTLRAFLGAARFDYLFSIANSRRLPADVLGLPARGAINYHDAPLPRFAGLSALSWGLLEREPTWAITWHVMEPGLDTGAILEQTPVAIAPDDTSLTLGLKCAEACVRGLRNLLPALEAGTARGTPQDLSARTYYSRSARPEAACLLRWERPAEELSALVRALDFGPSENRLGLPKALVGDTFLAVSTLRVVDGPRGAAPGTVLAIGDDSITVATASHPVAVGGWATLDRATALSPAECARRFGLGAGSVLGVPDAATLDLLSRASAAVAGQERHWCNTLAAVHPATLPGARTARGLGTTSPAPGGGAALGGPAQRRGLSRLSWRVPEATLEAIVGAGPAPPRPAWLVAAWGALVGRMSGLDSLDLALPVQDGTLPWADLDALFAAEVPLRFEVDERTTLRDLALATVERLDGLRTRLTYPRDLVARSAQLRAERPPSGGGRSGFRLPVGVAVVADVGALDGSATEARLLIAEGSDQVALCYDPAGFDPEAMARVQEGFQTFLGSLAVEPALPLAQVGLLSAAARHQVVVEWNSTRVDLPSGLTVPSLFEAQVARTPEAVALRHEDRTLSYRELDRRASSLARRLRALALRPEELIGLSVRRSCEMVVGMLAIMKAGGAYVPLDPEDPEPRLAHLLDRTRLRVVVTAEERPTFAPTPERAIQVVLIEGVGQAGDDEDRAGAPLPVVSADALAYVLHTSGSSGAPKGVMIEHRALVNFLLAAVRHYELGPGERALQFASFTFDASVEEIFAPLVAGATLVLRTEQSLQSAEELAGACAAWSITRLLLPTSYWHHLCEKMGADGWRLPEAVGLVVIGGEAALPGAFALWQRHVGRRAKLINAYGPTEATVVATWCELTAADLAPDDQLPIGRPLPNVQALVLDRHLQPVPVGVAGELCIGGRGLARGYLGQPELTAASFVPNPHDDGASPRLYRTGDRVRLRADGSVVYLGRLDAQLKVAGYRIEPAEVEGALRQAPDVADCVVGAWDVPAGGARLVAWVVTRSGRAPEPRAVRAFLRERLPDYLVPTALTQVPSLPVDRHGKVDRRALPPPEFHPTGHGTERAAPLSPAEEDLVRIWGDLLRVAEVGLDDDFFALGGNSLQAAQVLNRLRRELGVNLPLRTLFELPTIREQARCVQAARAAGGADGADGAGRCS